MAVPAIKTEGAEALLAGLPAPAPGAAWAETARARAAERLHAMGAPHPRDEYWRFLNPAPLLAPAPAVTPQDAGCAGTFDAAAPLRIVFTDGVLDHAASDALALEGVEILPLAEALSADITWAREVFGKLEEAGQSPVPRPFAALNTARAGAGLAIRATGAVARPVQIEHRRSAPDADVVLHHIVRVEADARLTLLETGLGGARLNTVLEADIARGGALDHLRLQGRSHDRQVITHLFARLGAAAALKSFTLSVDGRMTRNEAVVTFTGNDASAHLAGASAGGAGFVGDDTVFVTHDAVNCESRQVFKKVLRDGALGIFQGKILVRPHAQKTDGYQISQGLLLDEDSQFLAKPELEIYADDVACSHGSTCGAVDPTSLFYLTSRGIPRGQAEGLLVLAFLDEAIQEIGDEGLADAVRALLGRWLG